MNIINLKNIKFNYPNQERTTLDVPDFCIAAGQKVFLYGPSGCGKTTLLEMLSGILLPQTGEVKINETDLTKLNSSERDFFRAANIGYIFQSFNLIPYLSVAENITLPLYLNSERRKNVSVQNESTELQYLCEHLGLLDFLSRPVTELSVGQQQRVAAARAFLGKPKLILADEPTSALDFDHREKFIQLLFTLCEKQKTSVLFVSHDKTLQNLFDQSVSLQDINKAGQK